MGRIWFGYATESLLDAAEGGLIRQGPPTGSQLEMLANADLAVWGDMERRRPNESTRYWKAMMLAPSLEVWVALLRGQKVPRKRLDPDALRRFHRR
jgi:hypothetical protein